MSEQITDRQEYYVNVHESEGAEGTLLFNFSPRSPHRDRRRESSSADARHYAVAVTMRGGDLTLDWARTPDVPDVMAREEIEEEIADRMNERATWIERVTSLVDQVERWAAELGWSTRRVEKKLDDDRIGRHRVPALLMQQETFRVLLEPVGRTTPGAEGVVDLYLMPAYDDIASLYFYDDRWNLHYISPGTTGVTSVREAAPAPLTKKSLENVLSEMRRDALQT